MAKTILTGLLSISSRLPLGVLYLFADFISFVLYRLVKYRRKVVRKNLVESFPDKEIAEIKKIEREFYGYLGDQIVETLKLLHISDKELRKRIQVNNFEVINKTLSEGRNAVLLMGHYGNWEWVQEICRYFLPETYMASIYHPLSNKTWDEIFLDIRSRWGAHIIPMKRAPRILLDKRNFPWVCGFIADHRPHQRHENNCLEFLNHKTWFIYGAEEIGEKVGADFFYLEMNRVRRGCYSICFHPLIPESKKLPYPYTRQFWKEFEKTLKNAPAFWLWSHKRWKS